MGVSIALERPDSPAGSFDLGRYTITRKFRVIADSLQVGPIQVGNAVGIPPLYSTYATGTENQPYMRVRSIDCDRLGPAQLVWIVTVKYETPPEKSSKDSSGGGGKDSGTGGTGQESADQFTNPIAEIPSVKTHFTEHEEIIDQSYNISTGIVGPVSSSAGEVYDPPAKRQSRYMVLEIGRNEDLAAPHPGLAVLFQNTCNSDVFWSQPAGCVRCTNIVAERQVRQLKDGTNVAFLRVTYTFEFRPSWDQQLLDYGNYYNAFVLSVFGVITGTKVTEFVSSKSTPRTGLLDGTGNALPDPSLFTLQAGKIKVVALTQSQPAYFREALKIRVANINSSGGLPSPLQANTDYYVKSPTNLPFIGSNGQMPTSIFDLSATPGGTALTLSGGTGVNFIYPQPVFFTNRPYARMAFGLLNLPQSFQEVQ